MIKTCTLLFLFTLLQCSWNNQEQSIPEKLCFSQNNRNELCFSSSPHQHHQNCTTNVKQIEHTFPLKLRWPLPEHLRRYNSVQIFQIQSTVFNFELRSNYAIPPKEFFVLYSQKPQLQIIAGDKKNPLLQNAEEAQCLTIDKNGLLIPQS